MLAGETDHRQIDNQYDGDLAETSGAGGQGRPLCDSET